MWKSFILLLWLAVPLCGYQFYRADYMYYQHACREQRRECNQRAEIIKRYSGYFTDRAGVISIWDDRYGARTWLREWRLLLDTMEQERQALPNTGLTYYPQAAAALAQAETALDEQRKAIEQAQRQQGFAQDLVDSMAELEQLIADTRAASEYYRHSNSDSVYMFLQEILAQREAAYYSRRREYDGFMDNVAKELANSRRCAGDVRRATAQLNSKFKLDEQRTYRQELRQRFAKFNLGEQLGSLISDIV
jgi:hypothetical protein